MTVLHRRFCIFDFYKVAPKCVPGLFFDWVQNRTLVSYYIWTLHMYFQVQIHQSSVTAIWINQLWINCHVVTILCRFCNKIRLKRKHFSIPYFPRSMPQRLIWVRLHQLLIGHCLSIPLTFCVYNSIISVLYMSIACWIWLIGWCHFSLVVVLVLF